MASKNLSRSSREDVAFVALLKTCTKQKNLQKGIQIHDDILRRGLLKKNIFIGNSLVNLYAKCGALAKAQQVFDELPVRDVISWNTLVTGYAQGGHGEEPLTCFKGMQGEGLLPDAVTFSCIIKACGIIGAIGMGKELHAEIAVNGLLVKDIVLGNALVDMYAKCGTLVKAQEVFDELVDQNVISWNALIGGYCQHGQGEAALQCFEQMKCKGFTPDAVTFICVINACSSTQAAEKGEEIYTEIVRRNLLENNVVLGSALVDMLAKTGKVILAQQVFDKLTIRNVVLWTALISGYCEHGEAEKALECFKQMNEEGVPPDAVTFSCILKACGSIRAVDKGRDVHAEVVRKGLVRECTIVGNAVVDMYAKCGVLTQARDVFDGLLVRDVVSWNTLIAGYGQCEHGEDGLHCYGRMKCEGLMPDAVTFSCVLKACATIGAAEKGLEAHTTIVAQGLLGGSIVVGNALVDMYAKCGDIFKAQEVFSDLPMRDAVSWNALLAGYCEHELSEEMLHCFKQMKSEGFSPDAVTLSCTLKMCGTIGASVRGKDIHAEIIRLGWLGDNSVVGNALVNMYAKCGVLEKAQQVFDELPGRDAISWNTLIARYCEHGHGEEVLNHLERMKSEDFSPDAATFASILRACSSTGEAKKGQTCFETISSGILNLEHYSCMVDLLARAGRLDEAIAMVKNMPSVDYLPAWAAVLCACQKWANVKLGRLAFENILRLDKKFSVAYVCMRDIYSTVGTQEDVNKLEALRLENEASMEPMDPM